MKSYEKCSTLDRNQPFILRLDGKNFSKLTRGLKKPFDTSFLDAMIFTLMEEFRPSTGYCHSDEISLVFNLESEYPFGMRTEIDFYR